MNLRFVFSEIVHSKGQGAIFVFCVALSLVSLVAVNSFRRDVNLSLLADARKLHGGDVIIRSHQPFSPAMLNKLALLRGDRGEDMTRSWEFYSVARSIKNEKTVLANVKVVDEQYPLYGAVQLRSKQKFQERLQAGSIIVASSLITRLETAVGDSIQLGSTQLTIAGVIEGESQRPVDFFEFGPRIFVSEKDLEALALVGKGSRIHYETLIKTRSQEETDDLAARLQEQATPGMENVTTYASASSRVKRFFDNLLFFLALISVFTMLLAGMGMQSSLAALLRHKEKSLAIIRAVGASSSFLYTNYFLLVLILSLLGCGVGLFGAYILEQNFTTVFAGLLPDNIELGLAWQDVVEGVLLGLAVVLFFSYFPLLSIASVKPVAMLRKEVSQEYSKSTYIFFGCGAFLFTGLIMRQLNDVKIGLYFVAGTFGLVTLIAALVALLLYLIGRQKGGSLAFRQAKKSMLRPGNAALAITATLSSALALLLTIGLVQNNLRSTYIASYPEDAPNLFCIDIQKNQKDGFSELLGGTAEMFPVIRARLLAINGEPIEREKELKRRGDNLAREFNLTYRDHLLDDEILVEGTGILDVTQLLPGHIPVSLLDMVADRSDMEIGDILTFNVQGLTLKAQVVSVRSRTKSMLYPFFYFVFTEKDLGPAPQTFFAALTMDKEEIPKVESKIVEKFPNISTINVAETAKELGRIMDKLSSVITFFSLFSIAAGLLILVSSILATRLARIQEAVFYKILGANSFFVWRVFGFENLTLAVISGFCALLVSQVASWSLCHFVLDIEHSPYLGFCLLLLLASTFIVVATGLLCSLSIIRRRPGQFLSKRSVE